MTLRVTWLLAELTLAAAANSALLNERLICDQWRASMQDCLITLKVFQNGALRKMFGSKRRSRILGKTAYFRAW